MDDSGSTTNEHSSGFIEAIQAKLKEGQEQDLPVRDSLERIPLDEAPTDTRLVISFRDASRAMDCDDLRPWPTDKDIFTVQQTPESTGPVLRQDHEPLCYFYFNPATDHITLSHKCKGPVEVVDLAAGERRGVPPRQCAGIRPGCWRVYGPRGRGLVPEVLLDFRLLPRPYATTIMERGGSGSKRKFMRSVQHVPRGHIHPVEQLSLGQTLSIRPRSGSTSGHPDAAYTLKHMRTAAVKQTACVVIGHHSKLGRVAIKVVRREHKSDSRVIPSIARHWADEKRFLERLHHPCIVELLGADARLYALYLKVLPGKDLSQWVDTGHFFTCGSEGDANRTILRISCQMTSAVAFLHKQARIVHNDIKPANIVAHLPRGTKLVDAKLIDFGHASVVEAADCPGGTPWYMPFDAPNDQGPARDCWALGVTLLFVMRAIPLPEKTQPVWRIDQVLHDDIQAQLMRDWLASIQDRRKELGDGDIESFVHELLSPDAEERCRYLRRLARTLPLGSLT
ncbi:hypothetical protein Purlil1_12072 [Purpureocillium lilacinum]|uniref:Protein kinase domain-containing protein n=1 Tax=Purpureocillium lilacinum TaxID=33203 RepID=A0ABR0BHZ6_PURLI|nr:hypothetical protein Purlil1_12072 [Purpureocillium lilacinum]